MFYAQTTVLMLFWDGFTPTAASSVGVPSICVTLPSRQATFTYPSRSLTATGVTR